MSSVFSAAKSLWNSAESGVKSVAEAVGLRQPGLNFDAPELVQPAQAAPGRKQDTGAIVALGADNADERLSNRNSGLANLRRSSGSGLQI